MFVDSSLGIIGVGDVANVRCLVAKVTFDQCRNRYALNIVRDISCDNPNHDLRADYMLLLH